MDAARRKQTYRQHRDATNNDRDETPRWDPSPGQQPTDYPGGAGQARDDPLGRVIDVQVASDEVGRHHNAGESPERDRGDPEGRTIQRHGDLRAWHAGEYNGASRGFRHRLLDR